MGGEWWVMGGGGGVCLCGTFGGRGVVGRWQSVCCGRGVSLAGRMRVRVHLVGEYM